LLGSTPPAPLRRVPSAFEISPAGPNERLEAERENHVVLAVCAVHSLGA
jgi:hypothetical protein